jgi:hypothetical protein
MLLLVGTAAQLLSFAAVHKLPVDTGEAVEPSGRSGPEYWLGLGPARLRRVNALALASGLALCVLLSAGLGQNAVSSVLLSILVTAFGRKLWLDSRVASA